MVGAFIWVGLCIAVGACAVEKNRNGGVWFLISLFFSPLLGAVFLFLVSLKDKEKKAKAEKEREEIELSHSTVSAEYFSSKIKKLYDLKEGNVIDEDEFFEQKRKIISDFIVKKPKEEPEDFLTALISLVDKDALSKDELSQIKKHVL
ncbi:hypothetical protein [Alcanivorax sp.]|uniref:hypothetical protein n=1 Tax=Alcanivorax sp. TaxID=1872427 RepID=UPI003BACEBD1